MFGVWEHPSNRVRFSLCLYAVTVCHYASSLLSCLLPDLIHRENHTFISLYYKVTMFNSFSPPSVHHKAAIFKVITTCYNTLASTGT